jgi:hypothetical protein
MIDGYRFALSDAPACQTGIDFCALLPIQFEFESRVGWSVCGLRRRSKTMPFYAMKVVLLWSRTGREEGLSSCCGAVLPPVPLTKQILAPGHLHQGMNDDENKEEEEQEQEEEQGEDRGEEVSGALPMQAARRPSRPHPLTTLPASACTRSSTMGPASRTSGGGTLLSPPYSLRSSSTPSFPGM